MILLFFKSTCFFFFSKAKLFLLLLRNQRRSTTTTLQFLQEARAATTTTKRSSGNHHAQTKNNAMAATITPRRPHYLFPPSPFPFVGGAAILLFPFGWYLLSTYFYGVVHHVLLNQTRSSKCINFVEVALSRSLFGRRKAPPPKGGRDKGSNTPHMEGGKDGRQHHRMWLLVCSFCGNRT